MKPIEFAYVGVLLAGSVLLGWRNRYVFAPMGTVTIGALENGMESMKNIISGVTGGSGFVRVSNIGRADRTLLSNRNVQAMLAVIRRGEGTSGINGYKTLYGGGLFESFADHPDTPITRWGRTSTAAGAYQILSRNPDTWTETKNAMGLKDFSPTSQDLAALGRIAFRGVLADVAAGRWQAAIKGNGKRGHGLRWEWASLPESPYGQGVISWETAKRVFLASGGIPSGSVLV